MGSWIELVIFHKHTVPVQTGRNIVGCYMLRPFVQPGCCLLLRIDGSCFAMFETGQTFSPV